MLSAASSGGSTGGAFGGGAFPEGGPRGGRSLGGGGGWAYPLPLPPWGMASSSWVFVRQCCTTRRCTGRKGTAYLHTSNCTAHVQLTAPRVANTQFPLHKSPPPPWGYTLYSCPSPLNNFNSAPLPQMGRYLPKRVPPPPPPSLPSVTVFL